MKVTLHGELGTLFGKDWELAVKTPKEAIHAIEANKEGLFKHLVDRDKDGVKYRVVIDGQDFELEEELYIPLKKITTIHFIPVMQGAASSGMWNLIAGIVLIIIGVVLLFTPLGFLGVPLITLGIGMALGGAYQLLFPPPGPPSLGKGHNEKPGSKPSYVFSGAINTVRQGNCVPVCYGKMIVGSQTISTGIFTDDGGD